MASYNTLAGLVQFNDQNLADLNVSDLLDDAPLMQGGKQRNRAQILEADDCIKLVFPRCP